MLMGQVDRVESVQRKFTKRLPGYSLDYKSRLTRLHAHRQSWTETAHIWHHRYLQGCLWSFKWRFSLSKASSIHLLREVILTNFSLTVTMSTCTSIFLFAAYIKYTWNSLPAKPNNFSSLARFAGFVRSANLSQSIARALTVAVS